MAVHPLLADLGKGSEPRALAVQDFGQGTMQRWPLWLFYRYDEMNEKNGYRN